MKRLLYILMIIASTCLIIWLVLPEWRGVMPGYGVHGDCNAKGDPCNRIGKALAFGSLGRAF